MQKRFSKSSCALLQKEKMGWNRWRAGGKDLLEISTPTAHSQGTTSNTRSSETWNALMMENTHLPGDLPQHSTTFLANDFFPPMCSPNLPSCTLWPLPLVQLSATVRRISLHHLCNGPSSSCRLPADHPLASSAPDWASLAHSPDFRASWKPSTGSPPVSQEGWTAARLYENFVFFISDSASILERTRDQKGNPTTDGSSKTPECLQGLIIATTL